MYCFQIWAQYSLVVEHLPNVCSPEYNPGTTERSAFSIQFSPPILSGLVVLARLGWAVCSRNSVEGLLSDFSLWELSPRCTAVPSHVLGASSSSVFPEMAAVLLHQLLTLAAL